MTAPDHIDSLARFLLKPKGPPTATDVGDDLVGHLLPGKNFRPAVGRQLVWAAVLSLLPVSDRPGYDGQNHRWVLAHLLARVELPTRFDDAIPGITNNELNTARKLNQRWKELAFWPLAPTKKTTQRRALAIASGDYGQSRTALNYRRPKDLSGQASIFLRAVWQALSDTLADDTWFQDAAVAAEATVAIRVRTEGRPPDDNPAAAQSTLAPSDTREPALHPSTPAVLQLRGRPRVFENRLKELEVVSNLVSGPEVSAPPLVVITGGRGVGKTSFVEFWSDQNADLFPDGQLLVDFPGMRLQSEDSVLERALRHVLHSLDPAQPALPETMTELTALFRSRTADKRLLIFVDDAHSAEEVQSFLPTRMGSALLSTSWRVPGGLVALDASLVNLAVFDDDDVCYRLLERFVDTDRLARDENATRELIDLCGGLPEALTICGAHLRLHPEYSVRDWVTRIRGNHSTLKGLELKGHRSLHLIYTEVVETLSTEARLCYGLLASHPARLLTLRMIQVATGYELHVAMGARDELVESHLLERGSSIAGQPGFRFHDLVFEHASAAAEAFDPIVRRESLLRILDDAVALAYSIDLGMGVERLRVSRAPTTDANLRPISTHAEGLRTFRGFQTYLLAAQVRAFETGNWEHAWQIGEFLWPALNASDHGDASLPVFSLAAEAALRGGTPEIQARAKMLHGLALLWSDKISESAQALSGIKRLAEKDIALLASAYEMSGHWYAANGEHRRALREYAHSLRLHHRAEVDRGVALQQRFVGRELGRLGHGRLASKAFAEAEAYFTATDETIQICRVLREWSATSVSADGLGRDPIRLAMDAVELAVSINDLFEEGRSSVAVGDAILRLAHEEVATAREWYDRARNAYDAIGSTRAASVPTV